MYIMQLGGGNGEIENWVRIIRGSAEQRRSDYHVDRGEESDDRISPSEESGTPVKE